MIIEKDKAVGIFWASCSASCHELWGTSDCSGWIMKKECIKHMKELELWEFAHSLKEKNIIYGDIREFGTIQSDHLTYTHVIGHVSGYNPS